MEKEGTPTEDLGALEEKLGHKFRDRKLIERALTHRSWAHEYVGPGEETRARLLHNEALEFVGDSVLGLVVADMLFRAHPEVTEGELSRMKHRLVSTQTLARAARRMDLGQHLRIGRGEEKTGGRRKRALLADVFEAVLAAVYLDEGFDAARSFIERALGKEIEETEPGNSTDYKTLLQERIQAERHVMPQYELIDTEGPPHDRVFHVEVYWEETRVKGQGGTIKAAEMEAARRALANLDDGFERSDSSEENDSSDESDENEASEETVEGDA